MLLAPGMFLESDDLVERLANAAKGTGRPVTFLLGSALTTPRGDRPGVPSVSEMLKLVERRLGRTLPDGCSYQHAFETLIRAQGVDAANQLIRAAVLRARTTSGDTSDVEAIDADLRGWVVPPGLHSIASLAAHFPRGFGKTILTTNFDPLIEVALSLVRVPWYSTALHADGSLLYLRGVGTHVIHLHGYWWGSDTLHTSSQLTLKRPQLRASLRTVLGSCTLVVLGYGGWEDAFMAALADVVNENSVRPDVLWAFYSDDPSAIVQDHGHVMELLGDLQATHHCQFYRGVDADTVLADTLTAALEQRPAESLGVFLERALLLRSGRVSLPGQTTLAGTDSPGELVKALRAFGKDLPARAALAMSEYLLPFLERQPIHQAPQARQFANVRAIVKAASAVLERPDSANVESLMPEIKTIESLHRPLAKDSFEAAVLRVIGDAVCSALTFATNTRHSWSGGPPWPESSSDWAASSVHVAKRALFDHESVIWSYLSAKLLEHATQQGVATDGGVAGPTALFDAPG